MMVSVNYESELEKAFNAGWLAAIAGMIQPPGPKVPTTFKEWLAEQRKREPIARGVAA